MTTNSLITIFNRRVSSTGDEVMQATVIREANWHESLNSTDGEHGDNADRFKVRIPIDADQSGRVFTDANAYRKLNDEECAQFWTIQKEDIVLRGEMPGTYTDSTDILKASERAFLVNSYADNTIRGSRAMKHWRIGGS